MKKESKIYIAGHNGMVGSAIMRKLKKEGFHNLIYKRSSELDLINQQHVADFFNKEKPEFVFLAAAKVGGIHANNSYKADFIYENLMIQNNIIHNSYLNKVEKLLFLGSSCIYPKMAPQPLREDYLLTGKLEPTNDAYAVAKIAGIKMCESYREQYDCNFISAMPTNLYGINDNYDLNNSHVLPALLRKFHEAKINHNPEVVVWGSGNPKREFLLVDDLAEASYFLMQNYSEPQLVNIGTGTDVSIQELADTIKEVVQYEGNIVWDTSKPDGTPRKLMDVSKLNKLGWKYNVDLKEGVQKTYNYILENGYDKIVI